MNDALVAIGVFLYIVISAIFYISVQERAKVNGFRKIKWTYLDIISFIVTLPISLMLACVLVPLCLIMAVLFFLVSLTKPDVWITKIEQYIERASSKLNHWANNNKVLQKLLTPISKDNKDNL